MLTQPADERAATPEDSEYDAYSALREIAADIGGVGPKSFWPLGSTMRRAARISRLRAC